MLSTQYQSMFWFAVISSMCLQETLKGNLCTLIKETFKNSQAWWFHTCCPISYFHTFLTSVFFFVSFLSLTSIFLLVVKSCITFLRKYICKLCKVFTIYRGWNKEIRTWPDINIQEIRTQNTAGIALEESPTKLFQL